MSPAAASPARKAGIDRRVQAHGLPHTYASQLDRERTPINVIGDAVGHSTLAVTDRYLAFRYYRKAVLASSASSAASAMCWLSCLEDKLRARANVAHVRTAA